MLQRLLCAALAVCAFPAVSLFGQPEAGDPVEIGFTFAGSAIIDGIVDGAWEEVPHYPIGNVLLKGRDEVEGPENHSGWWKSMFDEENLYLLISVTDDILVPLVDGSNDKAEAPFADQVAIQSFGSEQLAGRSGRMGRLGHSRLYS